jgi:Ca-activated chloride channel homolog
MRVLIRLVILVLFLLAGVSTLLSQDRTRILFVFDASNSMNGYWEGERKINIATKLLSSTLEELYGNDNLELGLRVYGHQTKHIPGQQDCDDTELVVPFSTGNNLVIKKELQRIQPKGTTPIARSLEKAAYDFPDQDARNVIILITDGIEACDEDPCAVSRALQSKGVIVKPFIIGIGIDDKYKSTFECVGNYFDASNPEIFERVLDIVVTQALNSTTAQINLNDVHSNPLESNVPITVYDENSGQVVYQLVHTLNSKGLPDTLSIDPLFTYEFVVHTLPPVSKSGQKLIPGKHNTIEINTPQGFLKLRFDGGRSDYESLQCIVKSQNQCEVVNAQAFDTEEKYIVGEYELEILTTPRTLISSVRIEQSKTTEIVIPNPGVLFLQTGSTGFGGVLKEAKNAWDLVISFSEGDPSGRYLLQPGNYKVLFRSKNAQQTLYTIEKDFSIRSGTSTNLNLK